MRLGLFALVSLFVVSSVRGDSVAGQLVGHWQYSEKGLTADYVIKGDNTFTGHLYHQGKAAWHCTGKWTLSGKTINTVLTRSSAEQIPAGTKDRKVLVEVTKDYCRLQNQDGSIWKYVRAP